MREDLAKGGWRPKASKQLGGHTDRTSQNGVFWPWTFYSGVVKLGLKWAQHIADGGSDSGRAGKSARSCAACVSDPRTISTSPAAVAGQ
jgi:hypothetical protein